MFAISPDFDGQSETFFLIESWTTGASPRFTADQLRAEGLTGSRWWSLDELLSTDSEQVAPRRLPVLIEDLLAHGPPTKVIDAGV